MPVVFVIVFAARWSSPLAVPDYCSRPTPHETYPPCTMHNPPHYEARLNTGGKPVLADVKNVLFQGLRAEQGSCYIARVFIC